MRGWSFCLVGIISLIFSSASFAGVLLHFDQFEYTVAEGETLEISVLLDADDQQAGNQPLTAGLLGMAVEVSFDPNLLGLAQGLTDAMVIQLPDGLSSNGLFGDPTRVLNEPGFAKVNAAVRIDQDVYRGEDRGDGVLEMRLFTVLLTGRNVGQSTLDLDLFLQRVTEKVLVDGAGNVLDGSANLSFGSAVVNVVIPEPSTLGLLCMGGYFCLSSRRRSVAAKLAAYPPVFNR